MTSRNGCQAKTHKRHGFLRHPTLSSACLTGGKDAAHDVLLPGDCSDDGVPCPTHAVLHSAPPEPHYPVVETIQRNNARREVADDTVAAVDSKASTAQATNIAILRRVFSRGTTSQTTNNSQTAVRQRTTTTTTTTGQPRATNTIIKRSNTRSSKTTTSITSLASQLARTYLVGTGTMTPRRPNPSWPCRSEPKPYTSSQSVTAIVCCPPQATCMHLNAERGLHTKEGVY